MARQRFFNRHPAATSLLIGLLMFIAGDMIATRIFKWGTARATHGWNHIEPSPLYHHDMVKNHDADTAWGIYPYHISTNSLGFKDAAPREVSLTPAGRRILFLGDSFTEGIGCSYPDTFVAMAGQALKGDGVEVLNAACASYSPVIYLRKTEYLLEKGLKFDEAAVFLDISDAEDDSVVYYVDDKGAIENRSDGYILSVEKPSLSFLGRHPRLDLLLDGYLAVTKSLYLAADNAVLKRRDPARYYLRRDVTDYRMGRGSWTLDRRMYERFGERGLANMSANMDRLFVLLKQRGIRLIVAVYPWPVQILYNDADSIQVRFWKQWCADRGVGFINLFPDFIAPGTSLEERVQTVRRYYLRHDLHWNRAGHELVADRFVGEYRRQRSAVPEDAAYEPR